MSSCLKEQAVPPVPESTRPPAEHGPMIDDQIHQEDIVPVHPELLWSRIRHAYREPFSEFFGTFIMILFGDGVVAQVVLSNGEKGDYQSISWGWGLGVMLGVYTGGISGAHLNPAVTFANCVFRKFPWKKFPIYAVAQILGAMTAAAVVYGNYRSAIDEFEGGTHIRQFFSEFIASSMLMFMIYALKDDGNIGAGPLTPLGLFFVIFGIGCAWGWETGYAINLARDFGPRLVSYMIGYGPNVWKAGNYYFWVPMVAPFFGCTFGAFLYDVFLWTGESPVNTPWMGLKRLARPRRRSSRTDKWTSA
ncbi:hypothetical protein DV737_g4137, partial [Chaetothyriales sp. CBS 132003]